MATKKKTAEITRIGLPNFQVLEFVVRGADGSPMIMESKKGAEALALELYGESMDPKRKAGLKAQRPGGSAGSGKKEGKIKSGVRTDEILQKEFEYSQYRIAGEDNAWGIPSAGFRSSLMDIAKNKALGDLTGTDIARNIWVLSDCKSTYGDALTRLRCSPPYQDIDMGLNSGPTGSPRVICRSKIDEWETTLRVRFDADRFEAEEVLSLFARAGLCDGYGGKRLGKGHECGEYYILDDPQPKVFKQSTRSLVPKIKRK